MPSGEGFSCFASPGLQNHGCSLRRRLAEVRTWHVEVFAYVIDLPDEAGIRVDAGLAVESNRVRAPGGVPQLVDDIHVLFTHSISFVMSGLSLTASKIAGGAVKVARHDIPADTASAGQY